MYIYIYIYIHMYVYVYIYIYIYIYVQKKSKSVKSLKYMDEFFSLTNDFSLLESYPVYKIAKYKPATVVK